MPKYSAPDAFRPAIQRTKALLFRPFRFSFWCRLAILGFLTGELTANGCSFNGNFPSDFPRDSGQQHFMPPAEVWHRIASHFWLLFGIATVVFVLMLVFMYISSRCRFMLFEAVVDGDIRLRRAWRKWKDAGTSYFLFMLAYTVVLWLLLGLIIGVPLLIARLSGFSIRENLALAALGITFMVVIGLAILVAGITSYVLIKDFAVPIMALEGLTIGPALRRLGEIIKQEKLSFAGYIGMKIVITIGVGIASALASLIILLPIIFIVAIIAVLAILTAASAGLTWTPVTISIAVAFGMNLILGIGLLLTFLHTPLAAFFPSYALFYLAGRYAPLHDRLFPPPAPPVPPQAAPPEPPEIPPQPLPEST